MSGTPSSYALQGVEQLANYGHLRQEAFSNITSGIGGGKFGPNILLTREQMATMMVKVLELSNITMKPTSIPFIDDAQISAYAKVAIYKAAYLFD